MRALQITKWHSDPEITEVPRPDPGPGEVVVKVAAAGCCHSDIHIIDELGDVSPWPLPFTLGHENAGWVDELGTGVGGLEVGQPVAVYGAYGCGACDRCLVGAPNYCENPMGAPMPGGGCGLGADGGMAEYVRVPGPQYLVPLPDGMDPVLAAPLTDAGLTPYHAIRRSTHKLAPGSSTVVIGVGGLGHLAIQILKATTATRVIAVDNRPEALKLAEECGADVTIEAGDAAGVEARSATANGRGADLVLDFVGNDGTLALATSTTRTMGDLTIVGIAGGTLPYNFYAVPYEASVQSVYWGSRAELAEVLDLGARGLITPEITTYPLDEAPAAYQALREGTLKGRAVVIPNKAP
jgi:propanol-preferring alcohol dehydrogenase